MMLSKNDKGVFVSGIDTEIGKTVASAVLVRALKADYWKPIQSGDLHYSDSHKVAEWGKHENLTIHPEAYQLNTPMSPHASAAIDGLTISLDQIHLPKTDNLLVVEGAGGLMVPLNKEEYIIDLITYLGLPVVLVTKNYLGSINHTLLSLEALEKRNIPIAGVILNGPVVPTTEEVIFKNLPKKMLFRLEEWPEVTQKVVSTFADALRL